MSHKNPPKLLTTLGDFTKNDLSFSINRLAETLIDKPFQKF